jgi:glycosyltransferase involved in cell wall biosynthesis
LVPYADGIIQMVGLRHLMGRFSLLPGFELEGLMMRGSFAYNRPAPAEAVRGRVWLTLTGAAPFKVVHHLDPIVIRALEQRSPILSRRVHLIPDPVERFDAPAKPEARRRLGIGEDGRYIGCVGIMDRRKGIDRLIHAFLAARLGRTDRLLLAGRQESAIRGLLADEAADAVREGRIIVLDRYISDEELRLSIAAMDVVCAPYPPDAGHSGSSSIVIHAAGQERPVLGSAFGWIGDVTDTGAFASAISESFDAGGEFRMTEGGRRFVEFHRPENFAACFTRRIRERLGLPADTGLPTWDWVLEATSESVQPTRSRM